MGIINFMLSRAILKRGFAASAEASPVIKPFRVVLKDLPYELGALEPVISSQTMDFHYGKHHRGYVNNLNMLMEKAAQAQAQNDMHTYVNLLQGIKFNGGGHLNHEFFWETLAPINAGGGVLPDKGAPLRNLLEDEWGSVENFITYFSTHTATLQGSGWGWLVYN